MNRVRNRLILLFLAATLAPMGVTAWIATSLLERSLSFASTRELDELSRSMEQVGRALYQQTRDSLRAEANAGNVPPKRYSLFDPEIQDFVQSDDIERFAVSGDKLIYLKREEREVLAYSLGMGGVSMDELAGQHASARALIDRLNARDLRRGFFYTFVLLAALAWLVALLAIVYWANRMSRPLEQLAEGLARLGAGDLSARLPEHGNNEVGAAMRAFNRTAEELQHSRDRLVHLTRLASWQTLARKMAHEVKNSLTPIRLTMEEMAVRRSDRDDKFLEQAAQIVCDEVSTLERRVRSFSEFAAEPPVRASEVDVNGLIEERISFLKTAHPEVIYTVRLASPKLVASADEDLLKGILTNLLENAAEAAGAGGVVLAKTSMLEGRVALEVHDSGPGLSLHARSSLFEPTISFKKTGMGLGLSIAKRSALLVGGDIAAIDGELGGAAFRVLLRRASSDAQPASAEPEHAWQPSAS